MPDALGRKVWFVEGEGPRLNPLIGEDSWRFDDVSRGLQRLAPVYEAVERIKAAIPKDIALIGFCGGPWTVATYMLQGAGGEKKISFCIFHSLNAKAVVPIVECALLLKIFDKDRQYILVNDILPPLFTPVDWSIDKNMVIH